MIEINEIGSNGYWTERTNTISEADPAPSRWTRSPMPVLNDGEYALWAGSGWVVTTAPPPVNHVHVKTSDEIASEQKQIINDSCDRALKVVKSGYPEFEIDTWYRQEKEAREYLIDPNISTPLLDSISAARGVAKADQASRIVQKADAFAVVAGNAVGKRQKLEDQINAILNDSGLIESDKITQIRGIVW